MVLSALFLAGSTAFAETGAIRIEAGQAMELSLTWPMKTADDAYFAPLPDWDKILGNLIEWPIALQNDLVFRWPAVWTTAYPDGLYLGPLTPCF